MRKSIRGMYTTDGAGEEFLTGAAEDAIVQRLKDRGIEEGEVPDALFAEEFQNELEAMIRQADEDYAEMEVDRYEAAYEDRMYYAGGPEADYIYG